MTQKERSKDPWEIFLHCEELWGCGKNWGLYVNDNRKSWGEGVTEMNDMI